MQHTVAAEFITAIYSTFIICVSAAHGVCEGSEEGDGWTVASRQHFSMQRMQAYQNPLEIVSFIVHFVYLVVLVVVFVQGG